MSPTQRLFPAALLVAIRLAGPPELEAQLLSRSHSSVVIEERSSATQPWDPTRLHPEQPALSQQSDTTAVPLDLRVARAARAPGLRENALLGATSKVTGLGAFPGTLLVAGLLYGIGEQRHDGELSDLGRELGTAAGASLGTAVALKLLVGRARPDVSPEAPHDVQLGRGFRGNDYQSFPSAHTAMAFATATVVTAELGNDGAARFWVPSAAYTLAALAGLSRIYHDEHWLTDVAAGAVLGLLTGVVVQLD